MYRITHLRGWNSLFKFGTWTFSRFHSNGILRNMWRTSVLSKQRGEAMGFQYFFGSSWDGRPDCGCRLIATTWPDRHPISISGFMAIFSLVLISDWRRHWKEKGTAKIGLFPNLIGHEDHRKRVSSPSLILFPFRLFLGVVLTIVPWLFWVLKG